MDVPHFKNHSACGGFSLLELSIVIAILSVVAIMGLEGAAAYIASTAYKSTVERMAIIDAALAKYRYVNGRLPCPALLTLPVTNSAYGKENCPPSATATAIGGGIARVTVDPNNPGSGYIGSYADVPLTITAPGGSGAAGRGTVDQATGAITSITIIDPGSGYTGGPVTVTPQFIGKGSGASFTGTPDTLKVAGGKIECVSTCAPVAGGSKYTESYTNVPVTFSNGSGTGASGMANVDPSSGEITSIAITNPGYGYKTTDTLIVNFGGSSDVSASANVRVSSILVGGLPVRDLNLPLSYALDAYNSKFIYYVTADMTAANTFAASNGVIQMRTGQLEEPCTTNCSTTVGGAAYAFLSVGKDQRGGYSQRGKFINDCIPTDLKSPPSNQQKFSSAIDAQNCIANGSANLVGTTIPLGVLYNSTFNNGTFNNGSQNNNYFDDIVTAHGKPEL